MALIPELMYSSEQVDVTRLGMKHLRSQTNTCDIFIVCGEEKLPAHKSILRSGTAYFETMFSSGLQEASSREIHFSTISAENMTLILDFIYLQSVTIELMSVDEIWDLLSAAHLLQVIPLANICAKQISKSISDDNWVTTLIQAKKYSNGILMSAAVQQIAFHDLSEDKEVLGLDFECFSALVTESSTLKCHSVDVLINLILIWVAQNETDRGKHLVDLFFPIDFSSASGDLVASLINSNNLVKKSPELSYMLLTKVSVIFANTVSTKAATNHPKLVVCFENGVYSFDFTQNQWSQFDLPLGCKLLTNGSMIATDNAMFFTAKWVNPKIYGRHADGGFDPACYGVGIMAFYPHNNLCCNIIDNKSTMITYSSKQPQLNDESGIAYLNNSLYVTGGGKPFLESYDTILKTWTSRANPILFRSHPKIVAMIYNLFIFGGREQSGYLPNGVERTVERYDLDFNHWTIITMVPDIKLDLETFSVVPNQTKIYLSTGACEEKTDKQCLFVYNPKENSWEEIMKDFKPQPGGLLNWVVCRSEPPLPFLFMKQDNKYYRVIPETQQCFLIVPRKGELVTEGMPENVSNAVIFA